MSFARAPQLQIKRPFTVADEIGLTFFCSRSGGSSEVHPSPDGHYFAVCTERGILDLNRVEDSLRFYQSQDIKNFLKHSSDSHPPSPVWIVTVSEKEGPVIVQWRWLADSSGVAFLNRAEGGSQRLTLANPRKKTLELLTDDLETVEEFDIHDRQHYVYTAFSRAAARAELRAEQRGAATVGTGRSLDQLLFPDDSDPDDSEYKSPFDRHQHTLRAMIGGKSFEVNHDGNPLVPKETMGKVYLALSPDGGSVVTTLQVVAVPASWEGLYPPPYASSPYRVRAGQTTSQYVRIDLRNGAVQPLTHAPTSNDGGWFISVGPSWSPDGQALLLPGTFLSSSIPSRPCVAVLELFTNTSSCVEALNGPTEAGWPKGSHTIQSVTFAGDRRHVIVVAKSRSDSSRSSREYVRRADSKWEVADSLTEQAAVGSGEIGLTVNQSVNDSPKLVATNGNISRVIFDPNPQLKNVELGSVSTYTWSDKDGRLWKGGLYQPINYDPKQRYPVVIQTHGFNESEFVPSGVFPTAFAAREMAAMGIAVLQVREPCAVATPTEGSCAVSGYEAAVNKLVSEGLADPERVGIIGFSRTCFYVLEALTASSVHFKAASITDGQMMTYLQYVETIGFNNSDIPRQFDAVMGAQPFGSGLQAWIERSPGFNLDKVKAPLLVVGEGRRSLLFFMWEPYATLRYLHRAVELIMLNTNEHVLTNPSVRLASQGGSVDWFRFWLQNYEDPNRLKVEQYARWRELRQLQKLSGRN